jgi:FkbM family methyltransferase
MKKVILDCGSNLGQGLYSIAKSFHVNGNDWEIHSFEANPETFKILKQNLENNNWLSDYCQNVNVYNQAVWIKNEKKQITLEYCPFERGWIGGATNIMEDNYQKPDYLKSWQIKSGQDVECIDFSEFILKNFTQNDYIVCKMDIEGAEYEIIRHLHETGALSYFDILYVEWHNHILHRKYSQNDIINLIYKNNVELRGWG